MKDGDILGSQFMGIVGAVGPCRGAGAGIDALSCSTYPPNHITTSSATNSAPRLSIATPTGQPRTSPLLFTKPVSTSIGGTLGCSSLKGTKITLYPLSGKRFHAPCWPTNIPWVKGVGRLLPSAEVRPNDAVGAPSA